MPECKQNFTNFSSFVFGQYFAKSVIIAFFNGLSEINLQIEGVKIHDIFLQYLEAIL